MADFKVYADDATWSGLKLTKRKTAKTDTSRPIPRRLRHLQLNIQASLGEQSIRKGKE